MNTNGSRRVGQHSEIGVMLPTYILTRALMPHVKLDLLCIDSHDLLRSQKKHYSDIHISWQWSQCGVGYQLLLPVMSSSCCCVQCMQCTILALKCN